MGLQYHTAQTVLTCLPLSCQALWVMLKVESTGQRVIQDLLSLHMLRYLSLTRVANRMHILATEMESARREQDD